MNDVWPFCILCFDQNGVPGCKSGSSAYIYEYFVFVGIQFDFYQATIILAQLCTYNI